MENIKAVEALKNSAELTEVMNELKNSKKRLTAMLSGIRAAERQREAELALAAEQEQAAEQGASQIVAEEAFVSDGAEAEIFAEEKVIAEARETEPEVKPAEPERKVADAPAQPVEEPAARAEQEEKPELPAEKPVEPPKQPKAEKSEARKPEDKTEKKAEPKAEKAEEKRPAAEPAKAEKPAEPAPAEEQPIVAGGIVFKKPIRKLSLEELEAINRPRQRTPKDKSAKSQGMTLQRTFGNDGPGRGRPGQNGSFNRDGQRPGAPRPGGSKPFGKPGAGVAPAPIPTAPSKSFGNKKKTPEKSNSFEDRKNMNKRTLMKKGLIQTAIFDEDRMGSKKYKAKKSKQQIAEERVKIEHAVVNTEIIPIKVLSEKLGISATEITKKLFKDGIIKTINETIDYESAAVLALDMGIELELKMDKTAEEVLAEFHDADTEDSGEMVERPPVVTIMGHVDHGKTSLLDAIRKTNVATGEAGGITQHIGAYTIKAGGRPITFIDTPGHEAFTAMRARGAMVTDIAILVVAADDGVMPQTIESINHAKAAGVPLIVAINKMDKPQADPERIKQQLTEYEILPEEWGGDTIMVPVSAHTGEGLDKLLENVLLLADVRGLKANPNRKAKGTIIEAKLDKGKGPVATVLVQNGTLRVGDTVISGTSTGRVRAMLDDKGRNVKEAGPSYPVAILGFNEVPGAGEPLFAVDDKLSKMVLEERINKIKNDMVTASTKVTLDDVFNKIAEGQVKGLNLIVKADVQGSVEAVKQALLKLSNEEVKVNVIHGGVGAINESDVMLASTASAIIIGFNVRPDSKAKQVAEHDGVDVRTYRIIYEAIDDITDALKGMLAPKFRETVCGQAEVRNVFKITGVGAVAGCYVIDGKMVRGAKLRLLRDNVVVYEGDIASLKRFKDDVKEVAQGFECGISIENYNDIKEGDVIEAFLMEEIKD